MTAIVETLFLIIGGSVLLGALAAAFVVRWIVLPTKKRD